MKWAVINEIRINFKLLRKILSLNFVMLVEPLASQNELKVKDLNINLAIPRNKILVAKYFYYKQYFSKDSFSISDLYFHYFSLFLGGI